MITFTSAQLDTWIATFLYPLARILALLVAAPIFNSAGLSTVIRLIFGLSLSLAIAPALPAGPIIPPGSWVGLFVLAQQVIIGVTLGLTLRLIFTAVDVAGELTGLQMGLSFASFFDPQSNAQTAVISSFLGLVTGLLFLSMNGHLLMLSVLAESFRFLPISATPFGAAGFGKFMLWSGVLFSAGLMLALPFIAALLIANISLGVLARIAPQLNIFAIGFPVTSITGFTMLMLTLPHLGTALTRLYERGFVAMSEVMRAGGAVF